MLTVAESRTDDGHAWGAGLLVAVATTALVDSLTTIASFSGSWIMLGIVAAMTLVGSLASIGPRSRPSFGRAAFVALAMPLTIFVMGLAGIAEAGIGPFFVLAAIAFVVVVLPFTLFFRYVGPLVMEGDALAVRMRSSALVTFFAAAWLVIGARRSESVIAAPTLLLAGCLAIAIASLVRKPRSHVVAHGAMASIAIVALVLGGMRWSKSYRNRYRGFVARPTTVPDLPARRAIALTARNGGTCALYDESTIYCFGENVGRFLGNGDRPYGGRALRGAPKLREIALGFASACGLDVERRVQCWSAVPGKLHDPGAPVVVPGLPNIEHVFLGDEIGYAAASDGSTWSFRSMDPSKPAELVADVRDVRASSASDSEACALDGAGRVWCWKERSTNQEPTKPTEVPLARPARSIAISAHVRYAVLDDDSLVWWGESHAHGFDPRATATPLPFSIGEPVARIVAGRVFACALTKSAHVSCWGAGGLWPDANHAVHAPSIVLGLERVVDLVALERSMCVQQEDGRVACWGGP